MCDQHNCVIVLKQNKKRENCNKFHNLYIKNSSKTEIVKSIHDKDKNFGYEIKQQITNNLIFLTPTQKMQNILPFLKDWGMIQNLTLISFDNQQKYKKNVQKATKLYNLDCKNNEIISKIRVSLQDL
eukprot:TRINITY_DN7868_c0_g2_i3.p1 TRINITY_DN7868_c0_g2~~TRINITY_DN7868_c0_g2_i3.p1  ORF type:complete len:127 (+),score=3.10 TRINITY_DN7868_c0_g2_i3:80-460(+)